MTENQYTSQLYAKFEKCVTQIEQRFFTGKGKHAFPKIVMAINNRVSSCVVAFVQADALYDKSTAEKIQYMGINPYYLDRSVKDVLSTICHELCHIYENAFIHIARNGYHDKQWEKLMLDCGLQPKYLNKSKTAVSHTIIEGGEFEKFVRDFVEENGEDFFSLCSYSRILDLKVRKELGLSEGEGDEPKPDNAGKTIKKYNRNKVKYTCPSCDAKVWGKTGLNIECSDCECSFTEELSGGENAEDN
jgi:predicted SprT family Zn-dependent metalloprotease